jgi:acetyltransferase
VGTWTAKDGSQVTFRPILPEDEGLLAKFHASLSDRTVYMRYLQPMMLQERVVHERLARLCHCDYDREIALVAERGNGDEERSILGITRLSKVHGTNEARLALLVADPFQGIGLGHELVRRSIEVASDEHLSGLTAALTADNQAMLHIFQKLGFTIASGEAENLVTATLKL